MFPCEWNLNAWSIICSLEGLEERNENITITTNTPSKHSKEQIINQAFKFHSQGNISEAAKYYQHFIDQGFKDYSVFSNYGIILKNLGRLKEAEISQKKAIEIKPDFAEAHNNLGKIYNLIGEYKKASDCFKYSLSLNSDNNSIRYLLGVSLYNEARSLSLQGFKKSTRNLRNESNAIYLKAFEESDVIAKIGLKNRRLQQYEKKEIIIKEDTIVLLNKLSKSINSLYGHTSSGNPSINSGPCGAFANEFFLQWNSRFINQVEICFQMGRLPYQCNHVFIRLPNNQIYDGGKGVHDFNTYKDSEFIIMKKYDLEVLDKYSWGLVRTYKECPNFSISKTSEVIAKDLDEIYFNLSWKMSRNNFQEKHEGIRKTKHSKTFRGMYQFWIFKKEH